MKKLWKPGLLACAFSVSACTSVERLRPDIEARLLPSRLDEIAYVNTLRSAFVETASPITPCFDGDSTYFRSDLQQGYQEHTAEQEGVGSGTDKCWTYKSAPGADAINQYLDAGYGLASIYCQRFFVIANQSRVKRDFQRDSVSNLDNLVGTVLSLASAGDRAIGIVDGAFGAADATYQSIDDAFLISPDLGNVRDLVLAAQQQHIRNTRRRPPTTYPGARQNIEDFAGYCTFTGMQGLVNNSVAEQARQADIGEAQIATNTDPADAALSEQPAPAAVGGQAGQQPQGAGGG